MEVLSCSGIRYVGDSDSPQETSGTETTYNGNSSRLECGKQIQVAQGEPNGLLLNAARPQEEMQGKGKAIIDEMLTSEAHHSGSSVFEHEVEGQNLPCDSHDLEDDQLHARGLDSEISLMVVDTIESELPGNSREEESFLSEAGWLEKDESVAVWVKWRGKWQAGIRCARADWPLLTIKAKPTHDRKKYIVVFFPRTRNYSWADVLLVRPISELPQPIAYRSHNVGVKMVNDLTIARRFIMQKVAVSMLNIIDLLHIEALSESFRNVVAWKDFALGASRCKSYFDLGKTLLKLQNTILQRYLNPNWLQHSLHSWAQRCRSAHSAESIELLKEELNDSILWNEVNSLPDAPLQPESSSEWKTWKHEVMKWFSTSHPMSSSGDAWQPSSDGPSTLDISRKRQKLEIRRADSHASHIKKSSHQTFPANVDSGFFDGQDTANAAKSLSEPSKYNILRDGHTATVDRWDKVIVAAGNPDIVQRRDVEWTPANGLVPKEPFSYGNKSRQCIAFIEAKGRQCVRWANEGDVYCCVHLASRFVSSSSKSESTLPIDAPLCEGTTTLGARCKHRSLLGSSFCKKHRPKNDLIMTLNSPENELKRKHEETISRSESTFCKDMVLFEDQHTPLQVDPVSFIGGEALNGRSSNLTEKPECSSRVYKRSEVACCIGLFPADGNNFCLESPKRHSLYCEQHLPSWLKRARNGKSRIISKEVFMDLLRDCCSQEQKVQLHQACDLFYRLFKSILSLRNPVPKEVQFQWAISEASKDPSVGEFLMKLVCSEKGRLMTLWGFNADKDAKFSSSSMEYPVPMPLAIDSSHGVEQTIRCKICSKEFHDEQALGTHWMNSHKKEAQWLFRGYVCAICLDSFTNKMLLEKHVQERHHVQFVEQCMLFQCIPCGSPFGNTDQLWLHVLSVHLADLRPSGVAENHNLTPNEDATEQLEVHNSTAMENNSEGQGCIRKFICRFCGLKFDLLPDLGRHHQAAHMGSNLARPRPQKRGSRFYAYRLKTGRLSRSRFKKGLGAASYSIRNKIGATMKKQILASNSGGSGTETARAQSHVTDTVSLGRLSESQCSDVSRILYSEIQKTKPRPSNLDILYLARSACCKVGLQVSLEGKYGVLPECLYLKAAKLCSEHNIQVNWHLEGFICPKGCKPFANQHPLSPLLPRAADLYIEPRSIHSVDPLNAEWEMDECHYVIDSRHFGEKLVQKLVTLCSDISFGKESVPIVCVVDKDIMDSFSVLSDGGQITKSLKPWEDFTYVLRPLIDQSLGLDVKGPHLGCVCKNSTCHPRTCDHVYLFDNDYEDARDIYGKSMHGRFPYDDQSRIILEEGYLVYECNHTCSCSSTCHNRVLQKGVQAQLEVFKTKNKGWAVRAGKAISRGMFVCEYIGEILSEHEANERRNRYGKEGCSYFYDIDGHSNDMSWLIEGQSPYVIDSTRYGNVSRFINHSCLPNLASHQVLVESMDYELAHIGFYASRDIAPGEELTYDYRYKLQPGEGYQCHCGTSKCRGRLY